MNGKHRLVLAAACVFAVAVLAGTASAELTGTNATAGPNTVTVSGTEPDGACLFGMGLLELGVFDTATDGETFYQWIDMAPAADGSFSFTFPGAGTNSDGSSASIVPNTSYGAWAWDACSGEGGFFTTLVTPSNAPPVVFHQPAGRAGYCSKDGQYLDLMLGQPLKDAKFVGAVFASDYQGIGLTCDPPPAGYRDTNTKVDQTGNPASAFYGGMYEYWTKS